MPLDPNEYIQEYRTTVIYRTDIPGGGFKERSSALRRVRLPGTQNLPYAPDESHFCVLNDNNNRVVEYSKFQRLPNPAWAHDIDNFPLNGGVSVAHASGQAQVQPLAVAHPPAGAPGPPLVNPAPVHPPTGPAVVQPSTAAPPQPQPANPGAAHPPVAPPAANLVAPAAGPAQAPPATPAKFRVIASNTHADPALVTATTNPTRSSSNNSADASISNGSAAVPPASPGRNPNNPIVVLDSPVRTISRRVLRNGTLEYCAGTRTWMMPRGTLPCCVRILYLEDHPNHSPANLMSAKLVQHTDTNLNTSDDRAPGASTSKGTGSQKRTHGAMDQPTASGSGTSSKKRRT